MSKSQVALKAQDNVSQYQKFSVQRVHRSQLKLAGYNPRQKMSRHKRLKLQKNLKSVGLVTAIIWNQRTGNVVGGHQRLAALDELEKGGDYLLDVAVVDLPPEVEKTQNVFLNNPLVQGTWDMDLLGGILREDPSNVEATGFDPMDIQVMFDDPELAPIFNNETGDEVMRDLLRVGGVRLADEELEDIDDDDEDVGDGQPLTEQERMRRRAVLEAEGGAILADEEDEEEEDDDDDDGLPAQRFGEDGQPLPLTAEEAAERERWQEIKAKQKERMQARQEEDDTEFYAVVGFTSEEQRKRLCRILGIEARASFADGSRVMMRLKQRKAS